MKLSGALTGLVVFTAGCGRAVSGSASSTLQDAAPSSSSAGIAAPSAAPTVCDVRHLQVSEMIVTAVAAGQQRWLGKFSLHVRGCGFYIGAQPWVMRIGDQQSFNGLGNESNLDWPLEGEPAIGDELFVGYGGPSMATGIHYEGLGKISVAHE